jgi:calcium-dependent protein kinase
MGCAASRVAADADDPNDARDDGPPAAPSRTQNSSSQSFTQKLRRATLGAAGVKDARDRHPPPLDPVLAARARALSERAASDGAGVLNAGSEASWAALGASASGAAATPSPTPGPWPPPPPPPPPPPGQAPPSSDPAPLALGAGGGGGGGGPPRRLRETYVRATLVSYGASCKVFTAHDRATGERVAVKTIPKARRGGEAAAGAQRRRVEREIGALVALRGHPHVVRFVEALEDARSYHIVMEHLSGGELFEHLSSAGPLTEATARRVGRALLRLLAHCHARGIAHMDVKPENIMFDADGPGGVLKVIDFGSAEWVLGAQEVSGAFGTVRYSSPEMANASAGQKTDVWSVGVVLYTLMSGKAPFLKDSDAKTLEMIAKGPKVKFSGGRWARVSPAARGAIRAMLAPDPADRPEAADALRLAWFSEPDEEEEAGEGWEEEEEEEEEDKEVGVVAGAAAGAAAAAAATTAAAAAAPPPPLPRRRRPAELDGTVIEALRGFACHSRARRLVMGVLAQGLRGGEAARLVATFLSLDADHDGTISLEELRAAARRAAPGVSDAEMLRVFRALDVDNTGSVDAREFVAGVLHRGGGRLPARARVAVAERTFKRLDAAAAGFFTRDALRSFLALSVPPGVYTPGADARLDRELDAEFDAMDENRDGRVTWEEFKGAVEAAVAGRSRGGAGSFGSGGGGSSSTDGRAASVSSGGGDGWSEVSSEAGGDRRMSSDGGGGGAGGAAAAASSVGGGSPVPSSFAGVRGPSPLGRSPPGAVGVGVGGAAAAAAPLPPPPPPAAAAAASGDDDDVKGGGPSRSA